MKQNSGAATAENLRQTCVSPPARSCSSWGALTGAGAGGQGGRDLGFLMNPGDGAVTAVDFHVPAPGGAPSHLLSGSSDGTLSVWQARPAVPLGRSSSEHSMSPRLSGI